MAILKNQGALNFMYIAENITPVIKTGVENIIKIFGR